MPTPVRTAIAGLAGLAMASAVMAGCGSGGAGGGASGQPATGNLQITYIAEPGTTPRQADLICPGDGPDALAACEQVESLSGAFDPVPGDQACSQQYGGPEQIRVYGEWAGRNVNTTLTRTNGCEIDRYASLAPVLLPLVGGPGGG